MNSSVTRITPEGNILLTKRYFFHLMKLPLYFSAQGNESLCAQDTDCMHVHTCISLSTGKRGQKEPQLAADPRKMWTIIAAMYFYHHSELLVFTVHIWNGVQGGELSEQINRRSQGPSWTEQ